MNTQYWNPMQNNCLYWDPITLATTINKTPSYESLSDEDKIQLRLDKMEISVKECNNIVNLHNKNVDKYSKRIELLINNSSHYMSEFYQESPNYSTTNMFDNLIWLSYTSKEKKDILDLELESYFTS